MVPLWSAAVAVESVVVAAELVVAVTNVVVVAAKLVMMVVAVVTRPCGAAGCAEAKLVVDSGVRRGASAVC